MVVHGLLFQNEKQKGFSISTTRFFVFLMVRIKSRDSSNEARLK